MVKYLFFLGVIVLGASVLVFLPRVARPRKPSAEKSTFTDAQIIRQTDRTPAAQTPAKTRPIQGPIDGKKASERLTGLSNVLQKLNRAGANPRQLDMKAPPLSKPEPQKASDGFGSVLPNGLPLWFRTLDKNEDGQVALSEWRESGKSFEEFRMYDLNGDGFITADELLRHVKKSFDLKLEKGQATYTGFISENDERYKGTKLSRIFTIKLEKGKTYQIDHVSQAFDAYLYLEDLDGNLLAEDDDGGGGTNARIVYRADKTDTCRVIATSINGARFGPFSLSVQIVGGFGRNLPKGLPAWFKELDKDEDGQISLFEWRRSGKTFDEFRAYDLNGDDFISAEEVLSRMKKLVDLRLERDQVNYQGSIDEAIEERYQGKKSFKVLTINLEKGKTYQIEQTSQDFFAFVFLEDSDGKVVGLHNSGGQGRTARIVHLAAKTGTYRIVATSQGGFRTGTFSLTVRVVDGFGPTAANGLPAWFKALDKDGDGQIALYEWREGGKSLEEFRKYDLNGDGIITAAELLRHTKTQIDLRAPRGQAKYIGAIEATDEKYQGKKRSKIFTLQFEKGKTYEIDLISQDFSAFLYLENPEGRILDKSQSGGKGLTARIVHRAANAGIYRLIATSHEGNKMGVFAISVRVKNN